MTENKVKIGIFGDFNREVLILPAQAEIMNGRSTTNQEKSRELEVRHWPGGSLALADAISSAIEVTKQRALAKITGLNKELEESRTFPERSEEIEKDIAGITGAAESLNSAEIVVSYKTDMEEGFAKWLTETVHEDDWLTLFEHFPQDDKKDAKSVFRIEQLVGQVRSEELPTQGKMGIGALTDDLLAKIGSPGAAECSWIVVIVDRNNKFRQKAEFKSWYEVLKKPEVKAIVLLASGKFATGEMWKIITNPDIKAIKVAIVTAYDLRSRFNIRQLSTLEQAADDFAKIMGREEMRELLKCDHLLVLFDDVSVLHLNQAGPPQEWESHCKCHLPPFLGENLIVDSIVRQPERFGWMTGQRLILTASIVRKLVLNIMWSSRQDKGSYTIPIEDGIKLGMALGKRHLRNGYEPRVVLDTNHTKGWVNALRRIFEADDLGPVATIPVVLDRAKGLKAGDGGNWGRLDIWHEVYGKEGYDNILLNIVRRGLKKVSETPLKKASETLGDSSCSTNPLSVVEQELKQVYLPYAQFGKVLTADREEIDSFLDIALLIQKYLQEPTWGRPLCLAVFGPPGSGKGFTIKEILSSVRRSDKTDPLVYNLSQFTSVDDLTAAFHQVQDRALAEDVPLVMFDEFDAYFGHDLGWLKYFLAPMQDGEFKGRSGTYRVGKAIFVFAGGIYSRHEDFLAQQTTNQKEFRDHKGPDFVSRLRGYLNIKGVNPARIPEAAETSKLSPTIKFRRAVLLHSLLDLHARSIFGRRREANIDASVIRAFLEVPEYRHGVRSMEAIIQMSLFDEVRSVERSKFNVASLPRTEQLNMHVNADAFNELAQSPGSTVNAEDEVRTQDNKK